jgi:FkbM family methyltransferase
MLKQLIKRTAQSFGYDIVRLAPPPKTSAEIQAALLPDAAVIFDVGAHIGRTAKEYRSLFPRALIYAFEPSPETFKTLKAALPGDPLFRPQNIALSDAAGHLAFNINKSTASSSLLPTAGASSSYWGPVGDTLRTITVPASTISEFCADVGIDRIDILKLDVQGTELRVLKGALPMLSKGQIKAIYTEILVAPSYDGQPPLDEIFCLMRTSGYLLHDIQNLYYMGGPLCQFDALFLLPETQNVLMMAAPISAN